MGEPRFAADVHLAKLARHLRMLGFDTWWKSDAQDDELLEISREEGRILLTRDRALSARAQPDRVYYVVSTDPKEQLQELLVRFALEEKVRSHKGFLTVCLECNRLLLPVAPHQVQERVPGHLLVEQTQFFLCPRCERVYWNGSHVDRMKKWVDELLQKSQKYQK